MKSLTILIFICALGLSAFGQSKNEIQKKELYLDFQRTFQIQT